MMISLRRQRPRSGQSAGATSGFTLTEMLLVIVVLGILVTLMLPRVSAITTHSKVNEALTVVAGDLEQAMGLAGRLRKPVTLAYVSGGKYTVRDRAASPNDTIRLTRDLGLASDQGVQEVAFTPTSVTIFPSGLVDQSLLVRITSNGYSRHVTLSPAGLVRMQ